MSRLVRIVYPGSRLLLGGLFLYAGLVKAGDVTAFARDIANYQILPYRWNYLVAATLPYIEFLAGLLLVANRRVRPAALVTGGLTAVFMLILVSVVARSLDIDCGCFGADGHTTAAQALWRDAGLLLLSIVTYRLRGRLQPG